MFVAISISNVILLLFSAQAATKTKHCLSHKRIIGKSKKEVKITEKVGKVLEIYWKIVTLGDNLI